MINSHLKEIGKLPFVAVDLALCSAKTVVSIGCTAVSVATLGRIPQIDLRSLVMSSYSVRLLTIPYMGIARVLNPGCVSDSDFQSHETPLLTKKISQLSSNMYLIAIYFSFTTNFFIQHVVSRGLILASGLIATISSVADLAIGLVAATFSLLTLGRIDSLHQFALQQLQVHPIGIVCRTVVLLMNPQMNGGFWLAMKEEGMLKF